MEKAGYKFGEQIFVALDPAASEFFDKKQNAYVFKKSDGSKRSAEELVDYYESLTRRFPIISIEDGCAENDWDGWKKLTTRLGDKIQLVGDDLFVTNVEFLRKGIEQGVANSILSESESDRHVDRNLRRDRSGDEEQLHRRDQPSFG